MYRQYMYVSSKAFLFCLQLERIFFPYNAVISSASPPCQYFTWFLGPISPSGLQHTPSFLPGLFSFLLCLLLFFSDIFQFQTLALLHIHLSFISPLCSSLAWATSRRCGHSWNKSFSTPPAVPEEKQACGVLFEKKSELAATQ